MGLLQGRTGDRGVQAVEVAQCLADCVQALPGQTRLLDGQPGGAAAVTDHLDRSVRVILQALDHRLNFCRGFLRTLCQQAHFIRDHGKPSTLFSGAGRFDGSIERQQVGLFGNRADHLQHAADLRALCGQGTNHVDRLIDGPRQLIDLLQAAIDVDLALLGLGLGVTHFAGRMFGIPGHVLHAVGHFIDRRRHQLHLL
ncbi:hypothetical protein D3C78_881450 [compost metagenome]